MPFRDVIGHEGPKALLRASMLHNRIAHAYLFHGDQSIGKRLLALRFIQALNCDAEAARDGPDACGICRSCVQIEAHTHPDCVWIEPDPEQANPQIKIEQIREIEQQIIYRPLIARFKAFLIDVADRMTIGAANALLKTLEEPPPHSVFVLVTSRLQALPATIRSRCQAVRFVPPALTQVEAALILQREIPPADARLLALISQARIGEALRTDLETVRAQQHEFSRLLSPATLGRVAQVMNVAEALHKADRVPEALEWLARRLRDLLLIRLGADPDLLINVEGLDEMKQAAQHLNPDALLDALEEIEQIGRASTRNINLQLALENMLLRLRESVYQPSAISRQPAAKPNAER